VTEYWIQVIATTSPDRVEMARERLREHQLSGRITTRVVDGRTFYRLRVGPYTDKREATKFLDWVNDIDGFEDSYISEEYSMRTVSG
jgi:cell division septation protein DedD